MRFTQLSALSLAIIATSSAVTVAQDSVDWTGFYAGIFGGYASGTADLTFTPPLPGAITSGDIGGLFGGVTIGVNHQLTQGFVVGAEADVGIANISGSRVFAALFPITTEVSTLGSVRGRVGYSVDRFLPFATAGVAVGNIRQSSPGPGGTDLTNEAALGWTAGAGIEYAVTDAFSVKAEYRYSQLDGKDTASPFPGVTNKSSFYTHDIRIGVNYGF